MDIPEVQISGLDGSHGPRNAQKAEMRDVDMDSSQHAAPTNDAITHDVPLPSATTELEQISTDEGMPLKRNPGLQFLGYGYHITSDGATLSFFAVQRPSAYTV